MEALIGLLLVALLFALAIAPVIILIQLSSIKESLRNLSAESQRLAALFTAHRQSAQTTPCAAPQAVQPAPQREVANSAAGASVPKSADSQVAAGVALPSAAIPAPQPPPLPLPPEPSLSQVRAPSAKPAAAPAPATPKSGGASEVLRKIWRWILVGEEYQSKGLSAESAIASTWMMRIGIIFMAGLAAYFLKWSVERELIGPAGRFAVGTLFGTGMLAAGIKLQQTRYRIIGEGLLGGGIVVLYLCIYAADVMYRLMPTPMAFALMAAVTVTAGFLAVRLDSMLVAVFGIVGGYLTPVALSTTVLSLPGFYAYLLILSVAVLAIALAKQWRLLNYLGFILTYALFFLHSMEHYDKTADFPVAVTFLTLLFVVQSLTVCVHTIIKREPSALVDAVHLTLNAIVYSAGGYFMIIEACGRPWPAIMSLGLALFYLLYIALFLRRGLKDRLLLLCLISLAAAYTAWTLPLLFEKESLTIALSLLAFVFLWLGHRVRSNFLQTLSYLVYGIVFFRVAMLDMPAGYSGNAAKITEWPVYFQSVLDRLFTFGTAIGSIAGAFLLSRRQPQGSNAILPENDIRAALPAAAAGGILFWTAVAFVFAFLQLEVNSMFRCWEPGRLPLLTLLWGVLALFLFGRLCAAAPERSSAAPLKRLTLLVLAVALIKLLLFDTMAWQLTADLIYRKDYIALDVLMRLLDFGFMLAVLLAMWRMLTRGATRALSGAPFGYTALALFFFVCTLELRTLLFWRLRSFLPAGISILWAVFAVSFIIFGISRGKGGLRAAGLLLFAVVCGKVVLSDLRELPIIFRIVALLVIGAALLLGSFAYLKSGPAAAEREES